MQLTLQRMSSSVLKRELRSKVASKLKNLDEVAWSEQSEAVCEQVSAENDWSQT